MGVRPVAPSFSAAPAASFAPALTAAPGALNGAFAVPLALTAAPLPAASAVPEIMPAPEIAAAAVPLQLLAEPAPAAQTRPAARERLRSAATTIRALAFLTVSALLPKAAPPSVESYLRENQDYAVVEKRGTLADGAVVEAGRADAPAARATLSHPGLKALLARADALKSGGGDEDVKLSALRAAVAEALPLGRDLPLRALERRSLRSGRTVELGAYVERGRGTEREAALLANVALTRAGFKPKLTRLENGRTVNLVHTARGQIVFDTVDPSRDGRRPQDVAAELAGPRVFNPAGKPKTSGIEAHASGSKELTFAVVGRSAADRLFKEDQKNYEAASGDQPVAAEWLYFPFYVDGHTALRIGDTLYEFTRRGWRASPARAFLFNNPYFDTQMERHPPMRLSPFTIGVPLTLTKSDAEKYAAAAEGKAWFSFWFNNCNQLPYRFLRRAGVLFGDGMYTSFSSIRSIRMLLLNPPAQAGTPRLYPLPNQAGSVEPLGPGVPRDLIEPHTVLRDFAMFVWNWPKFVFEKLPLRRARAATAPKG